MFHKLIKIGKSISYFYQTNGMRKLLNIDFVAKMPLKFKKTDQV
jgi:hypothetical protein